MVVCSINGPQMIKSRLEIEDRATFKVIWRGIPLKDSHPGSTLDPLCSPYLYSGSYVEKIHERFISSILDQVVLQTFFPRSGFLVTFQVVRNSGSLLACAINALCLALIDASIPMSSVFSAVSLAFLSSTDSQPVVDPTLEEEQVQPVLPLQYPP